MTKQVLGILVLAALGSLGARAGAAAENGTAPPAKVEPELAPDPKVMEILNGLGDNSSALLPPIKTAGDFNDVAKSYNMQKNGPVTRDYCIKMVWAPDRKRALFCGGNHGSPHRLNDAWEYDLPSNTWVLLFAPDPSRDVNQAVIEEYQAKGPDGATIKYRLLATKRGGPFDPCHTWWGLTYDPNARAMFWMCPVSFLRPDALKKLGTDGKDLAPGPELWGFYPYEKRWRRVCTDKAYTGGGPFRGCAESSALEYIPQLKKNLYFCYEWYWRGMFAYEAASNSWTELKPAGPTPPSGEMVAAYDSDNKVIVAQYSRDRSTWHYDLVTNKWEKISDPKTAPGEDHPRGGSSVSHFGYDPVGKRCLMFALYSTLSDDPKKPGLLSYDVKERKWTRLTPQGPENPWAQPNSRMGMGYFDPERNVMVMTNYETTWVYRYKRAAKQEGK